VERLLL